MTPARRDLSDVPGRARNLPPTKCLICRQGKHTSGQSRHACGDAQNGSALHKGLAMKAFLAIALIGLHAVSWAASSAEATITGFGTALLDLRPADGAAPTFVLDQASAASHYVVHGGAPCRSSSRRERIPARSNAADAGCHVDRHRNRLHHEGHRATERLRFLVAAELCQLFAESVLGSHAVS